MGERPHPLNLDGLLSRFNVCVCVFTAVEQHTPTLAVLWCARVLDMAIGGGREGSREVGYSPHMLAHLMSPPIVVLSIQLSDSLRWQLFADKIK